MTLNDLTAPMRALRLLAADFPHLPTPYIEFGPIFPEQLTLSLHDDLEAFEAWREALGVPTDAVTHREQSGGRTHVPRASISYAGAEVHLRGFSDVAATVGGAA